MTQTSSSTHWRKLLDRAHDPKALPLAVAILIPSELTPQQGQQLAKTLQSVPFAATIWVGETTGSIKDFAAARNGVFSLVQEPWILWLDSDEWLDSTPETRAELARLVTAPDLTGACFHRQDWFLGRPLRHGEPATVKFLRLMKSGTGEFHRPVHEVFKAKPGGKIIDSPVIIHHASHDSISSFLDSVSEYTRLEAQFRQWTRHPSAGRLIGEFLTFPKFKFCINYFWLGGWRDGWRGLVYAVMMSIHSAAVRIYGWELLVQERQKKLLGSETAL